MMTVSVFMFLILVIDILGCLICLFWIIPAMLIAGWFLGVVISWIEMYQEDGF